MYQTIDEVEDETSQADVSKASIWPWVATVVAGVILAVVVLLVMPSGTRETPSAPGGEDARTAYLAAIGESSPALRRARLSDFIQIYNDSPRASAVAAQLSVLDAREASDWAGVTDVLYDRRASRLDKVAAIDAYEAKWGANLLGGRADEIGALRASLEGEDDTPPPSRALVDEASPIPPSIQGQNMAGGVAIAPPPEIIELPQPPAVPPPARQVVETPPELRRAPTPSYPSSARRRRIGAIVELEMDIDERGRVDEVRIIRVVADRYGKDFARAAERAASRSRFRPRRLDGEPVPTVGYRKRYRFEP